MNDNWYVVTGGPSSGITSTSNFLAALGHHVVPEAARIVIDNGISKGKTLEDIRGDEYGFQIEVYDKKKEIEKNLSKNRTIFFQRGIPDTIAYLRMIGNDNEKIKNDCKESRYSKIFILEPLPYMQDHARTEGEEGAKSIFELLKQVYNELGMRVVIIPKATIEERARMIISEIEKND